MQRSHVWAPREGGGWLAPLTGPGLASQVISPGLIGRQCRKQAPSGAHGHAVPEPLPTADAAAAGGRAPRKTRTPKLVRHAFVVQQRSGLRLTHIAPGVGRPRHAEARTATTSTACGHPTTPPFNHIRAHKAPTAPPPPKATAASAPAVLDVLQQDGRPRNKDEQEGDLHCQVLPARQLGQAVEAAGKVGGGRR